MYSDKEHRQTTPIAGEPTDMNRAVTAGNINPAAPMITGVERAARGRLSHRGRGRVGNAFIGRDRAPCTQNQNASNSVGMIDESCNYRRDLVMAPQNQAIGAAGASSYQNQGNMPGASNSAAPMMRAGWRAPTGRYSRRGCERIVNEFISRNRSSLAQNQAIGTGSESSDQNRAVTAGNTNPAAPMITGVERAARGRLSHRGRGRVGNAFIGQNRSSLAQNQEIGAASESSYQNKGSMPGTSNSAAPIIRDGGRAPTGRYSRRGCERIVNEFISRNRSSLAQNQAIGATGEPNDQNQASILGTSNSAAPIITGEERAARDRLSRGGHSRVVNQFIGRASNLVPMIIGGTAHPLTSQTPTTSAAGEPNGHNQAFITATANPATPGAPHRLYPLEPPRIIGPHFEHGRGFYLVGPNPFNPQIMAQMIDEETIGVYQAIHAQIPMARGFIHFPTTIHPPVIPTHIIGQIAARMPEWFEIRRRGQHEVIEAELNGILEQVGLNFQEVLRRFMLVHFPQTSNGLSEQQLDQSTIVYLFQPRQSVASDEASASGSGNGDGQSVSDDLDQSKACSFCFEVFELNDELRRLPCLHVFHLMCIDEWFKTKSKCPICQMSVKINNCALLANLEAGDTMEECLRKHEASLLNPPVTAPAPVPEPVGINQPGPSGLPRDHKH